MNTRDSYLKALAINEDNTKIRLIYADWLDDQGEHEEADRQRRWPAAKQWLKQLCDQDSFRGEPFSYEDLIKFGFNVTKEGLLADRVYMQNERMWDVLSGRSREFWEHWSIVTGSALPPGLEDEDFHYWECCPHEVYFWFGLPDKNAPEEE